MGLTTQHTHGARSINVSPAKVSMHSLMRATRRSILDIVIHL